MEDKQLDLGQYKLFHLTEMEQIPSTEEVKTMLTSGTPMAHGTTQAKLVEDDTGLAYDDRHVRYLGETEGPDYESLEQDTLPVDIEVEREQSEITAYNEPNVGVASD